MTASGILAAEMATATTLAHHTTTTTTRILRHHHQNQQQQHQSQANRVDDDSNGKPMEQDDIKSTCIYLIFKRFSSHIYIYVNFLSNRQLHDLQS
jgi:hypothetical protein